MLARQPHQAEARYELARTEQHIVAAEGRLCRQMKLIATLAAQGQDTTAAEALLRVIEQSLALMHEHRAMLLHELAVEPQESAVSH